MTHWVTVLLLACLGAACETGGEDDDDVGGSGGYDPDEPLEFDETQLSLGVGEVQTLSVQACCSFATLIDQPEFCRDGAPNVDTFGPNEPFTLEVSTMVVGASNGGVVELVVRVDPPTEPTTSFSSGFIEVPSEETLPAYASFTEANTFPCDTPMEVSFLRTDDVDTTLDLEVVLLTRGLHSTGFDMVEILP